MIRVKAQRTSITMGWLLFFTSQHQCASSPYCYLYNFYDADKETLLNNLKLEEFVIISCILMTLMFYSGLILLGEFRCLLEKKETIKGGR